MVSSAIAKIFLTTVISRLALGAPTVLDDGTLLENGKAAQELNIAYRTLNMTDPCINGNKACISGGVMSCQNGAWVVGQGACSKSQACFALPSNQRAGTLVTCTTEKNALSAIEASGATGGIFGNSNVKDMSTSSSNASTATNTARDSSQTDEPNNKDMDPACTDKSTPSSTVLPTSSSSTFTSTKTKDHSKATAAPSAPEVVTLTVTIGDEPTTLPSVTRTLSPDKASSLFAYLMANGATIIDSPSVSPTSLTPVPSITSSVSGYTS